MESESESEMVTARSRLSEDILQEIESIDTDSLAQLSDLEDDEQNVMYDDVKEIL